MQLAEVDRPARLRSSIGVLRNDGVAVTVWSALIIGIAIWGAVLDRQSRGTLRSMKLHAAPLFGHFDLYLSIGTLAALGVAVLLVTLLPGMLERRRWADGILLATAAAVLWTLVLATVRGWSGLTDPLADPHGYLAAVPSVSDPFHYLSGFVAGLSNQPLHVQGHPPGAVIGLWSLERIGLGGVGWAAALTIVAGCSTVAASAITVRALADERTARRCLPFLAIAPYALWVGVTIDAIFAGLIGWSIAGFALATTRDDGYGDLLAAGAGILFGLALLSTYGAAPLILVVGAIAYVKGSFRSAAIFGTSVAVPLLVAAAAGFWWFGGLDATVARYSAGVARHRPQTFFVFSNLAALALAIGPAAVVGMRRLREPRLLALVAATLVAVLAADLSGLSKGEVERIWLPFMPLLMVAVVALRPSRLRIFLGGQALLALAIASSVRMPW